MIDKENHRLRLHSDDAVYTFYRRRTLYNLA